ncbi:hypothetical protein [Defluviimonas sp. SAOS-178_SWC]|uniref:hypothetical protein n=1 Tax=Defluviimonas sp. SAOS-178_SWC TaxID=3121287 RepID=UPI0032215020
MRSPIILAAWIGLTGAALAQGYNVRGEVRDADFPNAPRFAEPLVTVSVTNSLQTQFFSSWNMDLETEDGGYQFHQFLGGLGLSNNWAIIDVQAGEGDFILPDPNAARAELKESAAGRDITFAINLRHRSAIAEGYRRSALDALKSPRLGTQDLEAANIASITAVEINPELDNYLLTLRVTAAAVRRGLQDFDGAVLTNEDLSTLKGYDDLTIDERWRVQSALLDTLAASEETRPLALQVGTDMLDEIPVDDPAALERLKIVRVFMTVSDLYARDGDCVSLADNSARAVSLAPAIHMDWTSQRGVMLEWGDCLERLSGIGNGRTSEEYIADAAATASLKAMWTSFAEAGAGVVDRIALSTVDRDARLRGLIEMAQAIRDRS